MDTTFSIDNYLSLNLSSSGLSDIDFEIKALTKHIYNFKKISTQEYMDIFSIADNYKRSKRIYALIKKNRNFLLSKMELDKIDAVMFLINMLYLKKLKIFKKIKNNKIELSFILDRKFRKRTKFDVSLNETGLSIVIEDTFKSFYLRKDIQLFWGCQADKIKVYCNNKVLKIVIPIISKSFTKLPILYKHKNLRPIDEAPIGATFVFNCIKFDYNVG